MNWAEWLYGRLADSPDITATVPPDRIRSGGSITEVPRDRPFIVIKLEDATPEGSYGEIQDASVWVHDLPGGYARINELLRLIREVLVGSVGGGEGITAHWQGDSAELADDARETIVRNASFRLAGRRVA